MTQWDSILHKYHIPYVHSSVDEHAAHFQELVVMNCAAINMGMHGSLWQDVFNSQDDAEKGELLGEMGFLVVFLKNLRIAFHSGCASVHSHQQCGRALPLEKSFCFVPTLS